MTEFSSRENKAAFVTGASRGIGAATAEALAQAGYDVAVGYQAKEKRANQVVERIQALGRLAIAVRGDITDEEGLANVAATLKNWKPLDVLVLNAAGGLEKDRVDADPQYALTINRNAQINLLAAQMDNLTNGSSVVYVTSDWAHKYGEVEMPPFDYEPVASSKNEGERALRAKQDELARVGSRLLVITGGLVKGTFVGDQAIRRFPEFASQQEAMGNIITTDDIGQRIAQAAENPHLPSGHTEWVGSDESTFMSHSRLTS